MITYFRCWYGLHCGLHVDGSDAHCRCDGCVSGGGGEVGGGGGGVGGRGGVGRGRGDPRETGNLKVKNEVKCSDYLCTP